MIINGVKQTDVKVLSSKLIPLENQDSNEFIGNNPIINEGNINFGKLELKLFISADTKDNLDIKISNLASKLRKCIIQLEDSSLEYVGNISGNVNISPITAVNYEITLSIRGYSRGILQTHITDSNNYKINIKGNRECGIIISYTATIDHIDLNLCGYEIKNIKKNDLIILDGIKKKVTKNGVNCFLDTNIFKFPSLKPGGNTLISDVSNIKIQYYPLYY